MNEKPCSAMPRRHAGADPALRSEPLVRPLAEQRRSLQASASASVSPSASFVSCSEGDPCGELSGELSDDERHYLVAAR